MSRTERNSLIYIHDIRMVNVFKIITNIDIQMMEKGGHDQGSGAMSRVARNGMGHGDVKGGQHDDQLTVIPFFIFI